MPSGPDRNKVFQKTVLDFYAKNGRHVLPWRKTSDPYKIMISEIMLQQTQVDRVIPYYLAFLKKFPSLKTLAKAPLSEVLRSWQGLGYNRRAKMLHDASKAILKEYKGIFPKEHAALIALPGIGPYTASAIRVFAFNEPDTLIETNVRTVYLHHFFPRANKVSDVRILSLIRVPKGTARTWYSALMDYGSYLKKTNPNPSRRSAHHPKQKPFKGSDREIRGAILKAHLAGKNIRALPFRGARVRMQILRLKKEGLLD